MDLFECKPGKIIKAYMNLIIEHQILNPGIDKQGVLEYIRENKDVIKERIA